MKEEMTWKQAFKKTGVKWIVVAVLVCATVSIYNKEPLGLYWIGFVSMAYLTGVYGTKKKWRGFV